LLLFRKKREAIEMEIKSNADTNESTACRSQIGKGAADGAELADRRLSAPFFSVPQPDREVRCSFPP
jgi:hypothetical protein